MLRGFSVLVADLEEGDAVAALFLREVESTGAAAQNLEPGGVGGEQGGDTEACGESNLLAEVVDGKVGEAVAETLGDLGSSDMVCSRQHRDELFASKPGNVVNLAEIVAQAARSMGENGIAPVVAVLVVDGLEAVEIEDDEREMGALAAGGLGGFGAHLLKSAPIQQAGERVGLRLGLKLVLELRHGEPDNAESSHNADKDRGEEGKGAGGRRTQGASRIVQVRLPGAIEIDERIEGE